MGANVKSFLYLVKIGFKSQMIYAKRFWFRIVQAGLSLMTMIFLWSALDKYGLNTETSLNVLLVYSTLSMLMSLVIPMNSISFAYEMDITKGNIQNKLLRPMSLDSVYYGESLGEACASLLINIIPVAVVMLAFSIIPQGVTPLRMGFFTLSLIIGIYIYFLIDNIAGYLCFWVHFGTTIRHFVEALFCAFSGRLIPLKLMPEWFAELAKYTPARLVFNDPLAIYTGMMDPAEYGEYFLRMVLWVGILFIIRMVLKKLSVRKVFVQGG